MPQMPNEEQRICPRGLECLPDDCPGPQRGEFLTPGIVIGNFVTYDSAGKGVMCGKELEPG